MTIKYAVGVVSPKVAMPTALSLSRIEYLEPVLIEWFSTVAAD